MKFLQILSIASVAFAAPAVLENQSPNNELAARGILLTSLSNTVMDTRDAINNNTGIIRGAVVTLVGGQAELAQQAIALIVQSLQATAGQLQLTGATLSANAVAMAAALANDTKALVAAEATQIQLAAAQAAAFLATLKTSLTLLSATVQAGLQAAIAEELAAVQAAVASFVAPLVTLANSVKSSVNAGNLQNTLQSIALQGLIPVIQTLAQAI